MARQKNSDNPVDQLDFKKLLGEIQPYDNKWIETVVKRMKEDSLVPAEMRESVNKTKIYNIINGVVRNGVWRMHTFRVVSDYKKELEGKLAQLVL